PPSHPAFYERNESFAGLDFTSDDLPGTSGAEGTRKPKEESPLLSDLLNAFAPHPTSSSRRSMSGDREEPDSPVKRLRMERAMRETDSLAARTCPYCGRVFENHLDVENHTAREHPSERTEVYGCSECSLACVSVRTLITHWEKHRDCPRGHLIVRTPHEVIESKGEQEKKPIFACGSCEKKFISRIGVKYHVKNVCKGAELIKLPSRELGGGGYDWNEVDPRSVRSNESDL
ncbi:hypothetical protein PMAYCL1PPCAC_24214, partial [Pristionchus mayeri]